MTVQDFLKELGGPTRVSRATGIPLTTVHSWGRENRVPHWRLPALAELAAAEGKQVPETFAPRSEAA